MTSTADFDKARKVLRRAVTHLSIRTPFITAPGMAIDYQITTDVGTACTDGKTIKFNPDFLNSMTEDQVIGLVAHENMHVGLGHPWRMGNRNLKAWNIAADCQINELIGNMNYKLPDGGINYDTLISKLVSVGCPRRKANTIRDESVEYTYNMIMEHLSDKSDKPGETQPGAPSPDNSSGNNQPSGNDKQSDTKIDFPEPKDGLVTAAPKEHDVEAKLAEQVERLAGAVETMEKIEANDKNIQNGSKRSQIPLGLKTLIKKAHTNKVDWRSALWKFASGQMPTDYTYTRVNKKYVDDQLYVPVVERSGVGNIAVCLDTSGSVNDATLSLFLAEVEAILDLVRPESVIIIPCDSKVYEPGVTVLYPGDTFSTANLGGRGGTCFKPPFAYLDKHDIVVDKVVYLTDMEGSFPADPGIPTLWVSTVSKNNTAPFGDVVVVDIS